MNEPRYTIVRGHRMEEGIGGLAADIAPPAPIPTWEWPLFWLHVNEGWAPRYGETLRATWEKWDELPDAMWLYKIRVHPEDVARFQVYANVDRDVIRGEEGEHAPAE